MDKGRDNNRTSVVVISLLTRVRLADRLLAMLPLVERLQCRSNRYLAQSSSLKMY